MKKQKILICILAIIFVVFGIILIIQSIAIKDIKESINQNNVEQENNIMFENTNNRPNELLGEWAGDVTSKLILNSDNGKYINIKGQEIDFEWYVSNENYITFINNDYQDEQFLNQTYKYECEQTTSGNMSLRLNLPNSESIIAKYLFLKGQ